MLAVIEDYASGRIEGWDDVQLLSMWEMLSDEVEIHKKGIGILEMVLQRRMESNNAKKLLVSIPDLVSTTLTVELGPPTYDPAKLRILGEHVPPEFFKKGFTPAHEETVIRQVPDKFDMRTVGSWKSYGQHIVDIIDAAEIPETRRISIKLQNGSVRWTRGDGRRINYPLEAEIPRQNTTTSRHPEQEELDATESS